MIQIGYDLKLFNVLSEVHGANTVADVAQDTGADPELISM